MYTPYHKHPVNHRPVGPVATAAKLRLIAFAAAAGLRRIEATSFVSPKAVPQMADAEAVMAGAGWRTGLALAGLALNRRGAERALAAGCDEVNFTLVASDSFNRRNQGVGTEASLAAWADVAALVKAAGRTATLTVGAAFGCPFEGEVPVRRLAEVVKAALGASPDETALADTIGVAAPSDVRERFAMVAALAPGARLRAHFHNTRNTGLADACAALEAGVTVLDAAIGGCPFAPRATGNIPTEDLLYMLHRMGLARHVALPPLLAASAWLEGVLGHPVPGLLGKAGPFPAAPAPGPATPRAMESA